MLNDKNPVFSHIEWINIVIKRVISQRNPETAYPLLSLSFASIKSDIFFDYPFDRDIDIEMLKTGVPYAFLLRAISDYNEKYSDPITNFQNVLSKLGILGYSPSIICNAQSLEQGDEDMHSAVIMLIEWYVADKSLSIDAICQDIKKLPRSFYVMKQQPMILEESICLWLSKFSCVHSLYEIKNLSNDIWSGQHVAAALSRAFPDIIPKNTVQYGSSLSSEKTAENWNLISRVSEKLLIYVPKFNHTNERLIMVFFSDVFHSTRSSVKKFIRLEPLPPPVITLVPDDDIIKKHNKPVNQQKIVQTKIRSSNSTLDYPFSSLHKKNYPLSGDSKSNSFVNKDKKASGLSNRTSKPKTKIIIEPPISQELPLNDPLNDTVVLNSSHIESFLLPESGKNDLEISNTIDTVLSQSLNTDNSIAFPENVINSNDNTPQLMVNQQDDDNEDVDNQQMNNSNNENVLKNINGTEVPSSELVDEDKQNDSLNLLVNNGEEECSMINILEKFPENSIDEKIDDIREPITPEFLENVKVSVVNTESTLNEGEPLSTSFVDVQSIHMDGNFEIEEEEIDDINTDLTRGISEQNYLLNNDQIVQPFNKDEENGLGIVTTIDNKLDNSINTQNDDNKPELNSGFESSPVIPLIFTNENNLEDCQIAENIDPELEDERLNIKVDDQNIDNSNDLNDNIETKIINNEKERDDEKIGEISELEPQIGNVYERNIDNGSNLNENDEIELNNDLLYDPIEENAINTVKEDSNPKPHSDIIGKTDDVDLNDIEILSAHENSKSNNDSESKGFNDSQSESVDDTKNHSLLDHISVDKHKVNNQELPFLLKKSCTPNDSPIGDTEKHPHLKKKYGRYSENTENKGTLRKMDINDHSMNHNFEYDTLSNSEAELTKNSSKNVPENRQHHYQSSHTQADSYNPAYHPQVNYPFYPYQIPQPYGFNTLFQPMMYMPHVMNPNKIMSKSFYTLYDNPSSDIVYNTNNISISSLRENRGIINNDTNEKAPHMKSRSFIAFPSVNLLPREKPNLIKDEIQFESNIQMTEAPTNNQQFVVSSQLIVDEKPVLNRINNPIYDDFDNSNTSDMFSADSVNEGEFNSEPSPKCRSLNRKKKVIYRKKHKKQQNIYESSFQDSKNQFIDEAQRFSISAENYSLEMSQKRLRNAAHSLSDTIKICDDTNVKNVEDNESFEDTKMSKIATDSASLLLCLTQQPLNWKGFSESEMRIMSNSIKMVSQFPPSEQTLENLFKTVRSLFSDNSDEKLVNSVYYATVALLRRISQKRDTIPQMLIELSSQIFENDPALSNKATQIISLEEPNSLLDGSSEIETQKTVERGIEAGLSHSFEEPMEEDTNINFDTRNRKIRAVFTSSLHVTHQVEKNTKTIPNNGMIANALRFTLVPSPNHYNLLKSLLNLIEGFPNDRIILNLSPMKMVLKGIYVLNADSTQISKIWGKGPEMIPDTNVSCFLRFSSSLKRFQPIPSHHFTQTTDAIILEKDK